jgi:rhodanese-related sulfurtransferase
MRVRAASISADPTAHRRVGGARFVIAFVALAGGLALAACGDDETTVADIDPAAAGAPTPGSPALVGPAEADALLSSPPPGLIVLDIRTPEEFAEGHLEGARMIDFYEPTFLADVGEIDRDAPIFIYCRSDNRSGQAVTAMVDMGFTNVTELDGGIVAWQAAGLPVVTG